MPARSLLFSLAALAAVPPCTEAPTIIKLAKASSETIVYVARTHPSPGSLDEVAVAFGETLGDELAIQSTLDRIAASDDPYGEAIATAVCSGLAQVATYEDEDDAEAPDTQSWEEFLTGQVASLLPFQPLSVVRSKVQLFNNAASLAEISPHAAVRYVQMCEGR
jgi:hypothetical protein